MATEIMLDDWEGLPALATVLAQSPAPMLRALSGVVEAMQVVARDHAETVAKLESETESKRLKIEAIEATAAAQTGSIAELDEENWALRQEAYALRVMNEALLDERAALRAMETAVVHHADRRRCVEALLQAVHADTRQRDARGDAIAAIAAELETVIKLAARTVALRRAAELLGRRP